MEADIVVAVIDPGGQIQLDRSDRGVATNTETGALNEIHILRGIESAAGVIEEKDVYELGDVIANKKSCSRNDSSISIVDLTGVAVQDIKIAGAVCQNLDQ